MTKITAKIIADSVNPRGTRITTFELEYPRLIHSELMTHRMFSRNSASSRAIPVSKMIDMVRIEPAHPVHWGANQPGMQADNELTGDVLDSIKTLWYLSSTSAANFAEQMNKLNGHKQVINRLLEPYQYMKVVVTATSYDNWFWLRKHKDADPTIRKLAEVMYDAYENSTPTELPIGAWHMPYITTEVNNNIVIYKIDGVEACVETALKVSASCCAQTSYRKTDTSIEKAIAIFDKLIKLEPMHSSPIEHQAQCFDSQYYWPAGTTHRDRNGVYYSGNFRDWIQYRQLLPNNAKDSWTA